MRSVQQATTAQFTIDCVAADNSGVSAGGESLLTGKDAMLSLLRQYISEQNSALRQQAERLLAGSDADAVHQVRVATRKLRAAFKAFANLFSQQ